MKTAVQLRQQSGDGQPKSDLICGVPSSVVRGTLGPVALFDSEQIVGYRVRYGRQVRVFVFRTLEVDDRLAASVPGVQPRVQLLLNVRSPGRARIVRELFASLAENGCDPSGLSDALYLRIGVALAGRLPSREIPTSLLPSPSPEGRQ